MRQIFVFGSNLAGRHGKGAALHAKKVWGAEQGVGRGLTGNAYALPTKDEKLKRRSIQEISHDWDLFIEFAASCLKVEDCLFLVTPFGTGLAGYSLNDISNMVMLTEKIPPNVVFTKEWFE